MCLREGIEMNDVLKKESRRILEEFGHHPSFAFFSPSNEPGGAWYRPLEQWMEETKAFDEALGYGGRRLYTAQSGWFYDKAPAEITKPDFIYFHRSAYGPFVVAPSVGKRDGGEEITLHPWKEQYALWYATSWDSGAPTRIILSLTR